MREDTQSNEPMGDKDDDIMEDDENQQHNGAEAGVVRGASQSIIRASAVSKAGGGGAAAARGGAASRGVARSGGSIRPPPVSSVPRALPKVRLPARGAAASRIPQTTPPPKIVKVKVPVRRVAKLSDRISTGLDVWDSATEASSDTFSNNHNNKKKKNKSKHKNIQTSKLQPASTTNGSAVSPIFDTNHNHIYRFRAFLTSLLKNTILGAAVFESYCYMIDNDIITIRDNTTIINTNHNKDDNSSYPVPQDTSKNITTIPSTHKEKKDSPREKGDTITTTPTRQLATHFIAGAIAGSFHGILSTAYERISTTNVFSQMTLPSTATATATTTTAAAAAAAATQTTTTTTKMFFTFLRSSTIVHQSIAHSLLFGSYETFKYFISNNNQYYSNNIHFLLSHIPSSTNRNEDNDTLNNQEQNVPGGSNSNNHNRDDHPGSDGNQFPQDPSPLQEQERQQQQVEYLFSVAMAGGLAGQVQHIINHILEQQQVHVSQSEANVPKTTKTATTTTTTTRLPFWNDKWTPNSRIFGIRTKLGVLLPSFRSILLAFPTSSIAFLAFEYSKE